MQPHDLRKRLSDFITAHQATLERVWLASPSLDVPQMPPALQSLYTAQAHTLLSLLAESLTHDASHVPVLNRSADAALQQEFPLVYRVHAMLALGDVLADSGLANGIALGSAAHLLEIIWQALATLPLKPAAHALFTERLAQLNHLSWVLNSLHDQHAILQAALREAPTLVEAESCTIWLWDADEGVPIVKVTPGEYTPACVVPPSLLHLLRQSGESSCGFSVDAGESAGADWPANLANRPVAFIPLPASAGCLGILTVHHAPTGHFSHDDILLLSSLGNQVATALQNAQLFASERHLISLLQNSIRQMVQATVSRLEQRETFVQSVLQVAEGLTRADAVCAWLQPEEQADVLTLTSGILASRCARGLVGLAGQFHQRMVQNALPLTGSIESVDGLAAVPADCYRRHYAIAEVMAEGKAIGLIYALSATPFGEDQVSFLGTMAEEIGMGLANMQQTTRNERLLFELANLNYFSEALAREAITSEFNPQRIMATTSKAVHRALNAPFVVAAWITADGALQVWPGTALGLAPSVERKLVAGTPDATLKLPLTIHHFVLRRLLKQQKTITSAMVQRRAKTAFPFLTSTGASDWACTPLVLSSGVRGVLLVADDHPRAFSSRDIALLVTYASQAALAMENHLLYDQVRGQLRQVELVHRISQSLGSSLELPEVLQGLLLALGEAWQTPAGLVTLRAEDSTVQHAAQWTGLMGYDPAALAYQPGEGIIGMVAQQCEPIASLHLRSDGRDPALRDMARSVGFASSVTVPLVTQREVLGTLTVFSNEMREFTPEEVELLRAMAADAAMAVQNARLYRQAQERARELGNLLKRTARETSATLTLAGELLEIAQRTDPPSAAIPRTLQRLECIAMLVTEVTEDMPAGFDVNDTLRHVIAERDLRRPEGERRPLVRITGVRLGLPREAATVLILFLHEWIRAAMEGMPDQHAGTMTLAFQQFGRELLVLVQDTATWPRDHARVNPAIIEIAEQRLRGTTTETWDEDRHEVRFRFPIPGSAASA